jgi:hypothetical protein
MVARREPSPGELEAAHLRKEAILAASKEGKSPAQLARALHLPVKAVESGLHPEAGQAPPPPTPPAGATIDAPVVSAAAEAIRWDLTPSDPFGSPVTPSWAGPFRSADVHETLLGILRESSIPEQVCRGVIRQFRHFPPSDLKALDGILAGFGASAVARRSVVTSYKLEQRDPTAEPPAISETSSDDDTIEIAIDPTGSGYPSFKRLPFKDLAKWGPFLAKPRPAVPPGPDSRDSLIESLREALHRKDLETMEARFAKQLEEAKAQFSNREPARTPEGLKLGAQSAATTAVLRTLDSKLAQTGAAQTVVKSITESPTVQKAIADAVLKAVRSPDDLASRAAPVSDADVAAEARRLGWDPDDPTEPTGEAVPPQGEGHSNGGVRPLYAGYYGSSPALLPPANGGSGGASQGEPGARKLGTGLGSQRDFT